MVDNVLKNFAERLGLALDRAFLLARHPCIGILGRVFFMRKLIFPRKRVASNFLQKFLRLFSKKRDVGISFYSEKGKGCDKIE